MSKFWKSSKVKLLAVGLLVGILAMSFSPISIQSDSPKTLLSIGNTHKVLRIGSSAYASGTFDYSYNGNPAHDTAQIQALLAVLATHGGGEMDTFTANVTVNAAITVPANVVVRGAGTSSYFARDGVNPIFIASANDTFYDMAFDAGGVTKASDTQVYNINGSTPTGRGATYVIAGSNAPALVKRQADNVSDGTADNAEIQAAITAAPVNSTVKLFGTFTLAAKLNISSKQYFTLDASEAKITIVNNFADIVTEISNSNGVTIKGGEWDGNKAGNPGSGYGGADTYMFMVDTSTNTTLRDMHIHDNNSVGIGVYGVDGASPTTFTKILNNTIAYIGWSGHATSDAIDYSSTGTTVANTNLLIQGNTIISPGDEGIGGDEGISDVQVLDNKVYSPGNAGIDIDNHANKPGMFRVEMANNQVYNPGIFGMGVMGNPTAAAISTDIDIHDNQIYGSGTTAGIQLTGTISHVSTDHNRLIGVTTNGIISSNTSIDSVSYNTILRSGVPTGNGIYISGNITQANYNTVDWAGAVSAVYGSPLKIIGGRGVNANTNIIGNSLHHLQGDGKGIWLDYTSNATVSQNKVCGAFSGGDEVPIFEGFFAVSNWWTGNDFRNANQVSSAGMHGTNSIFARNLGLVTENSGTFSITAGLWGVAVTHSMALTPTSVILTLSSNATALPYILSLGSSTFSANLSALQGSTVTGYWRAVSNTGN